MRSATCAIVALLVATSLAGCGDSKPPAGSTCSAPGFTSGNVYVNFTTNRTHFVVELWGDKAPVTVCNFLTYVAEKFYDNTCFHRIIPSFVVQGGGFDKAHCGDQRNEKSTHDPITLETQSKLRNTERTLAMARTNDPNSATSQFYINVANNSPGLDFDGPNAPGYAVFGKVVTGWDTVKKLESAGSSGGTPTQQVVVASAVVTTGP